MKKNLLTEMKKMIPEFDVNDPSTMEALSAMWKTPDGTYQRTPLATIKKETGKEFSKTLTQLLGDGNLQQSLNGASSVLFPGSDGVLSRASTHQYRKTFCNDLQEPPKRPNWFKRTFSVFFKAENKNYERHQRRVDALKEAYPPVSEAENSPAELPKEGKVVVPENWKDLEAVVKNSMFIQHNKLSVNAVLEKIAIQQQLPSAKPLMNTALAFQQGREPGENLKTGAHQLLLDALDPTKELRARHKDLPQQIANSEAFQLLTKDAGRLLNIRIKNNTVLDFYAHTIMADPKTFSSVSLPSEDLKSVILNLGNHCIAPPENLQELEARITAEKSSPQKDAPAKQKDAPEKQRESGAELALPHVKPPSKSKGMGGM